MSFEEERIEEEVEVNLDFEIEEIESDITKGSTLDMIKTFKPKQAQNALPNDIVSRARAMYIANDMSLTEVASSLGCSVRTLQRYCADQKWTIFKNNPNLLTYTEELFDEIYQNLNFYDMARAICSDMISLEMYQNPKDIKTIIEAFKMADERSTQLRIIGASARGETGGESIGQITTSESV